MLIMPITVVLLLVLLNGFFSMAEIALVSARVARLRALNEAGNLGAQAALELKSDPSRLLSTVQIGITVIAVLSGTFGQATLGDHLQNVFEGGSGFVARYAHVISMAIVVIGISYLSLIIGELVPKRIALAHPERIAVALARLMRGIARVGAPIEWFLSASTDLVLRLLPLRGEGAPPVTDEEISFMLREGTATGHIPQAETAIVEMALRLGDRRISAVMTPRTQIEWLDLDDPAEENRHKIRDSAHSRFPVVQGGTQQVIGIARAQGPAGRLPRRTALRYPGGDAAAALSAEHRHRAARPRSVQKFGRADGAGGRRVRRPRRAGRAQRHAPSAGRRHPGPATPIGRSCGARTEPC